MVILLSTFFCFFVNTFAHHNLFIGTLNSLLLGLSLYISSQAAKQLIKLPYLFILSLPLMPLFSFVPDRTILYFFLIFGLLSFLMALKLEKYRYIFVVAGVLAYVWGALISNGLFSGPFAPDYERFIWNVPGADQLIQNYQRDALYIPYRLRPLLFNKSIYIYTGLTQIANLLTLKNLYDTLLLANIYPLIFGIQKAFIKRNKLINTIVIFGTVLVIVVAGLNRSPDKFNSIFMATPLLTYLVMLGYKRMNKGVYILLFIISIILASTPNI